MKYSWVVYTKNNYYPKFFDTLEEAQEFVQTLINKGIGYGENDITIRREYF